MEREDKYEERGKGGGKRRKGIRRVEGGDSEKEDRWKVKRKEERKK